MSLGVSITVNSFSDYPKIQARANKPEEILEEKSKYLRAWQISAATISAIACAVFVALAVLAFIVLSQAVAIVSILALPALVPLLVGLIAVISTVALGTLVISKSISVHQNSQFQKLPELDLVHHEHPPIHVENPVLRNPIVGPKLLPPDPKDRVPLPEIQPLAQAPLQKKDFVGKYAFLTMDQNKTKEREKRFYVKASHPIPFNDLSAKPSDIEINGGICLLRRPGTYSINFGFMTWAKKAVFELQELDEESQPLVSIPGSRLTSGGDPLNVERMSSLNLLYVADRPNVILCLKNCGDEVELGYYSVAGSVIAYMYIEKKD